jgi:hypothetical protein
MLAGWLELLAESILVLDNELNSASCLTLCGLVGTSCASSSCITYGEQVGEPMICLGPAYLARCEGVANVAPPASTRTVTQK